MSGTERRQRFNFLGILFSIVVFQLAALIRYWSRLPGDWVGIGLYLATIVLTGLAAFVALKSLVSE